MVMQTAHEVETASVERALAAALASMRTAAEEAAAKGRDDFSDVWTAEVMDRQPLVFVAAVLPGLPGQTMTWLMEPEGDGVLSAEVTQFGSADSMPREVGYAHLELKTKLLDTIARDVGWLVKERSGQFPHEH